MKKSEKMKKFCFRRKILDDVQGLPVVVEFFSSISLRISLIFSKCVSFQKKNNNQFWGVTVFCIGKVTILVGRETKHSFYQRKFTIISDKVSSSNKSCSIRNISHSTSTTTTTTTTTTTNNKIPTQHHNTTIPQQPQQPPNGGVRCWPPCTSSSACCWWSFPSMPGRRRRPGRGGGRVGAGRRGGFLGVVLRSEKFQQFLFCDVPRFSSSTEVDIAVVTQ